MDRYDDLWAKSMKNIPLTAYNPSLVWMVVVLSMAAATLTCAYPVHVAGPGQGWITTKSEKTRENSKWILFFGAKWLILKSHCKVHWIGTPKNSGGDTVVSHSAKTIAIPAGGTNLVQSKINILVATISWKNTKSFLQTTYFS